jgi:hypothetical protein
MFSTAQVQKPRSYFFFACCNTEEKYCLPDRKKNGMWKFKIESANYPVFTRSPFRSLCLLSCYVRLRSTNSFHAIEIHLIQLFVWIFTGRCHWHNIVFLIWLKNWAEHGFLLKLCYATCIARFSPGLCHESQSPEGGFQRLYWRHHQGFTFHFWISSSCLLPDW